MAEILYLKNLSLPSIGDESDFLRSNYFQGGYHSSPYPFGIFPVIGLKQIDFAPITILCGDNGSGKSTLLNILSKRLEIPHNSPFNAAVYMEAFVDRCQCEYNYQTPPWVSKIITSDDVFRQSFHRREMNQVTHDLQMQTLQEGREMMHDYSLSVNFDDPDDVARFKRKAIAIGHRKDYSGPHKLVMKEVGKDIILHSNGENALEYFEEQIQPHGLYLLDEPENSLSIKRQLILKQYIEDMVQYEHCQFVIATHSPFLLALTDARVYNLDENPARVQNWTNIENVRAYFDFFQQYRELIDHPEPDAEIEEKSERIEDRFRILMTQNGYDWKSAELILKRLRYPNRIEEFLTWVSEYQQIYAGLFPAKGEVSACVDYICDWQERPEIKDR